MSDAESQRLPFSLETHLTGKSRIWFRVFFVPTLGFVALHLIYSLPALPIPSPIRQILGGILFVDSVVSMGLGAVAIWLTFMLGMLLGSLWLIGRFAPRARGWCGAWFENEPGERKWAFRPWVYVLVWSILAWGHVGLDIDPFMTIVCLSGVALLMPETWRLVQRAWAPLSDRYARWLVIFIALLWLVLSPDVATAFAVVVWILILLYVSRRLTKWLSLRDRLTFAILCIPIPQLITAVLPLGLDLHGGLPITDAMVYSFCEADDRLFAAVPRCGPGEFGLCKKGTIAEYDARTMKRIAEYEYLSDSFTGRVEQLLCMEDRVHVGMDITRVDGEKFAQSAIEFRLDDPTVFEVNVPRESAGDGLAWDSKRNAVFYTSSDNEIIRLDIETGEIDQSVGVTAGVSGAAAVKYHSIRDRLYVANFSGSVLEVHPETFKTTATYPILNSWELSLDEELDRLYVVGNWGLEVVDLRSGSVIHRARVGLVGRRAAVDTVNDIVYVPATAGGRVHAFDRVSLERLGALPLGSGIRLPYVSNEFGHVLATSGMAAYRWDAAALARSLRGGQ